jgi:hypothetical protein
MTAAASSSTHQQDYLHRCTITAAEVCDAITTVTALLHFCIVPLGGAFHHFVY